MCYVVLVLLSVDFALLFSISYGTVQVRKYNEKRRFFKIKNSSESHFFLAMIGLFGGNAQSYFHSRLAFSFCGRGRKNVSKNKQKILPTKPADGKQAVNPRFFY